MADFVFNIAKGRAAEMFRRVDTNDPATATIGVLILQTTGLESDATLKDYDTISAILAAANDEPTNTGYARKELTDADITYAGPNDGDDKMYLDIADQTWTAVQTAGGTWSKMIVYYSATDYTSAGDATNIPLTCHDFSVTPDGSNITAQIAANGFFEAS